MENVILILYNSTVWQPLSNRGFMSTNATVQYIFSSRQVGIFSPSCVCRMATWCSLNHNWCWRIIVCIFLSILILTRSSFSNSFDSVGNRLSGQCELTSLIDFVGFGIKMMCANFRTIGIYDTMLVKLLLLFGGG